MIKKKRSPSPLFIQFSSLGIQMAAIIGLFGYLGYFADQKLKFQQQYFTLFGLLFGVVISLIYVIKSIKKIEKNV